MRQLLLVALLAMAGKAAAQTAADSPVPQNGYVPDATTAVAIAEAVLRPLYGEHSQKLRKKLLEATLRNDSVWVVRSKHSKQYSKGGPYAEISKVNGRILVAELGK